MRIDADAGIGELGHVGAADDDEAGAPQPRHRGRIGVGRRGIVQRARAGAGHLPLDVEQILDRDRNAGEARRRRPGLAQRSMASAAASAASLVDMDEGALRLRRSDRRCWQGSPRPACARWCARPRDRRPARQGSDSNWSDGVLLVVIRGIAPRFPDRAARSSATCHARPAPASASPRRRAPAHHEIQRARLGSS